MRNNKQVYQVATVFIGSIVGAGISSGRELNQFFAVYGYKSVIGLLLCAISYIVVGKMVVEISQQYGAQSYSEFVDLVCTKWVGILTNIMLTVSLISSTSIILAGSSAVVHQYFGVPKWIGFLVMIVVSTVFLHRKTQGLMEVNSFIVPCLVIVMTTIFVGFANLRPEVASLQYIESIPPQKTNFWPSTFIYASFNIVSIIGIAVPLSYELKEKQNLIKGIVWGSVFLTLISIFIAFLMLVNPEYPGLYEIPILAVAHQVGPWVQMALMVVIWLEMFSSQVSNIYSLSKSMEQKFRVPYEKSIYMTLVLAIPFSLLGFSKLVEILYPLYGFLSLFLVVSCVHFYFKKRISVTFRKKHKQLTSYLHKM